MIHFCKEYIICIIRINSVAIKLYKNNGYVKIIEILMTCWTMKYKEQMFNIFNLNIPKIKMKKLL